MSGRLYVLGLRDVTVALFIIPGGEDLRDVQLGQLAFSMESRMVYSGVTWHIYVIIIRSYYSCYCGCHDQRLRHIVSKK